MGDSNDGRNSGEPRGVFGEDTAGLLGFLIPIYITLASADKGFGPLALASYGMHYSADLRASLGRPSGGSPPPIPCPNFGGTLADIRSEVRPNLVQFLTAKDHPTGSLTSRSSADPRASNAPYSSHVRATLAMAQKFDRASGINCAILAQLRSILGPYSGKCPSRVGGSHPDPRTMFGRASPWPHIPTLGRPS